MNLMNRCIVCGATNNLNTSMKVKVQLDSVQPGQDGTNLEYEVAFCDEHGETTTPKEAKEKVRAKLAEYDELRKKMAEFGIGVPEIPVSKPIEVRTSVPQVRPRPKVEQPVSGGRKMVEIAPVIIENDSGVNANVGVAINIDDSVKKELEIAKSKGKIDKNAKPIQTENVELQQVDNIPAPIPKRISHSDGSTMDITIVQTSDQDLQKKAKQIEQISKAGGNPSSYYGYAGSVDCNLCGGTGKTKAGGHICPKCKGKGIMG